MLTIVQAVVESFHQSLTDSDILFLVFKITKNDSVGKMKNMKKAQSKTLKVLRMFHIQVVTPLLLLGCMGVEVGHSDSWMWQRRTNENSQIMKEADF